MKLNKISRRELLKKLSFAFLASQLALHENSFADTDKKPLVARIHDSNASKAWDYSSSAPWDYTVEPKTLEDMRNDEFRKERYFDYINEDAVRRMLKRGLCEVTGTDSAGRAWQKILKKYKKGDKITIKINLNNASYREEITTNRLDQTAPLIKAVISDLTENVSVPEESITVADPSRWIHPRIITEKIPFKKIHWVDSRSTDLWDTKEIVRFTRDLPVRPERANPKKRLLPQKVYFYLARVYTEADHIINLCLMKNHGCGVTGAMKNHFGAIPPPSPKFLHTGLGEKSYIADLCSSKSIKYKVRLNICDAIFANWHDNVWSPRPWKTFSEESPNSLFLGIDPVAFDSVLLQHITDEVVAQGENAPKWVQEAVMKHQFLHYAMEYHRLGIHEHKPFSMIDYRQIENT
ncbi:MAG: DUF362 domain-containing protein [Candidatus Mariimomonas ferrooxydans]